MRDADADHGGDRHRRVGQRVAHQHAQLGQPLGARGADVVLAERFQHRGARDARDQRDVDHRQGDGRQDQVVQERPEAVGDAPIALHRQPAELERHDPDQDVGEHEHRHREAQHREAHQRAVEPAAEAPGGDHAERDRDHHREHDGQRGERQRRLEALADQRASPASCRSTTGRGRRCSRWPAQMPNCTGIERSRPRLARIAAICSLLAASPARIAAGSPGVRRSIRNTSTATTSSTGIVASSRRAMKWISSS